jgi:hypothetical protein
MQPVQVSATAVCSCRYTEAFIDFLTGKAPSERTWKGPESMRSKTAAYHGC